MKTPTTFAALEKLGRARLSENFFMRDFLYSEISAVYGIPNIPDNPDLAIEAGTQLCENLLEPIRAKFGHVAIRSSFFPKRAAFNIHWHELPERRIDSYIAPRGNLTKQGKPNWQGDHSAQYDWFAKAVI